jgi:hypothetical protein
MVLKVSRKTGGVISGGYESNNFHSTTGEAPYRSAGGVRFPGSHLAHLDLFIVNLWLRDLK